MIFASFANNPYETRSIKDLESFAKSIGMSSQEIKNSSKYIKEKITYREKKKAGLIPTEGVEILN